MDDKELENVKKNLKNVEFNNEDEDNEIIKEENNNKEPKGKKDNSKLIIIACCVVIAVLLLIIVLFMTGIFNKDTDSESAKEPDSENVTSIDPDESEINEQLEISKLSSYFLTNNYFFVADGTSKYITDLEGKVVLKLNDNSTFIKGKTNYILSKTTNGNSTNYTIKKVDEDRVIDVIKEDVTGKNGLIYDENDNLLGVYEVNNNNSTFYLIDNHVSKQINFTNQTINPSRSDEGIILYNGRYGIVSKNSLYGLYDMKDNKSLIEPKYQGLNNLHDDIFSASKDGKVGIINKNDKTLLDFDFDSIDYSNGLYFVGENGTFKIYDSNFKETEKTIELDLEHNLTAFKNVVVAKKNMNNSYAIIDKTGKVTDYDFNKFVIYGNYLITSKNNNSVITLYDSNIKKVQEFNTKRNDNNLATAAIYINNNFMINGRQLYDMKTGQFKFEVNTLSRSYQSYMVYLTINNNKANISIKLEDTEIGTIDNVDLVGFLQAENNGISVTKDYFILSVNDKNLLIKK